MKPALPFTLALLSATIAAHGSIHFGNGIKIGEVDQTSAIIWTRLTATPDRRADGTAFKPDDTRVPEGLTLADMKDSLMGTPGSVRVRYQPTGGIQKVTPWQPVDPDRDFTAQVRLRDLRPGTQYHLIIEGRSPGSIGPENHIEGIFHTAPASGRPAQVRFVVVTCHDFPRRDDGERGHLIYPAMAELAPDFLVHAGDIEYYDKPGPYAKSAELARFKWNRIFSLTNQREFYRSHAAYFMKDDHETLKNDCWPGQNYGDLTWEQGLAIYREQVPMGASTYRTYRWGKDLQVWMVEGRDFRSPNNLPDGPGKTIWGKLQKQWLFDSMQSSDAAFRVLISPTPIVGPDRTNKNDNHANAGFTHEGNEVRTFLAGLPNTFVICGDRHWQYASRDAETGLLEFACGAGSDAHAGGFSEALRTDEHRFLRIQGGFLSVEVDRDGDAPTITFRHHDVHGAVVFEDRYNR